MPDLKLTAAGDLDLSSGDLAVTDDYLGQDVDLEDVKAFAQSEPLSMICLSASRTETAEPLAAETHVVGELAVDGLDEFDGGTGGDGHGCLSVGKRGTCVFPLCRQL